MPKIISHRGYINGPTDKENQISSIVKCADLGIDVEIDLWYINDNFYLGHDKPEQYIDINCLYNYYNIIWCHAKSIECLNVLISRDFRCFAQDNDNYSLTSNQKIWVHYKQEDGFLKDKCIIMKLEPPKYKEKIDCYGICTDYPLAWKKNYE